MPQKTHTKILATIGPSSASKEQIEKLIDAGCDAFRFNFSHGTHAEHKERFEIVRKLSKESPAVFIGRKEPPYYSGGGHAGAEAARRRVSQRQRYAERGAEICAGHGA